MDSQLITAILARDRNSTSYKFALLRAVVQCIADHHSHKKKGSEGWVQFPLGILVYYWMLYYFPIVGSDIFIPQMNGEAPSPEEGMQMAIRPEMKKLTEHYRDLGSNAFAQFKMDIDLGNIPGFMMGDFLKAAKKIRKTIIKMPMKHLGFSQYEEHYHLMRKGASGRLSRVSLYHLIAGCGTFEIKKDLYEMLLELGPVIVGEESILNSWATYTTRAADLNQNVPDLQHNRILDVLSISHQDIRDTNEIRRLVALKDELSYCVWTGRRLDTGNLHVDHVIPFSVWQNNQLWNLLPASDTANSNKSDKIPSPELIDKCCDRIIHTWSLYDEHFDKRFKADAYTGLGYSGEGELITAVDSLKFKSEYLIKRRGMPAYDG